MLMFYWIQPFIWIKTMKYEADMNILELFYVFYAY